MRRARDFYDLNYDNSAITKAKTIKNGLINVWKRCKKDNLNLIT